MKAAVIGASGFVGKAVQKELVSRGHEVIAIGRNADKIEQDKNVKAVATSIDNADDVAKAVKGVDIVISAFNASRTNPDYRTEYLTGAKAIQEGVKKSGVKRVIIMGGAGSLFVAEGVQLVDTPQFPAEYKTEASTSRDYLNIIKNEKDLDWTFLSPPIELHPGTSGVRTGKYRVGNDNPIFNAEGRSLISVEDLAVAIVDEAENPKFSRKRFTVGV